MRKQQPSSNRNKASVVLNIFQGKEERGDSNHQRTKEVASRPKSSTVGIEMVADTQKREDNEDCDHAGPSNRTHVSQLQMDEGGRQTRRNGVRQNVLQLLQPKRLAINEAHEDGEESKTVIYLRNANLPGGMWKDMGVIFLPLGHEEAILEGTLLQEVPASRTVH